MKTPCRTTGFSFLPTAVLALALGSAAAQPPAAGPIPRPTPAGPEAGAPAPQSRPSGPLPPRRDAPLPPALPEGFLLPAEFRSLDGSGNLPGQPRAGTARQPFRRLAPNAYADGTGEPAGGDRPSARAISNAVAAATGVRPNSRHANDLFWQWGQFLDHDLDETPTAVPAESFPVRVPAGDPSFDPTGSGTAVIGLNRSAYTTVNGVREQTNAITSWIDGSMVYGSDAARAQALRAADGSGRLKTSAGPDGDLPPYNTDGVANIPPGPGFFLAGDVRANEQVGLLALHTLFVREHNQWADLYRAANPQADDEETYQFARLVVIAEIQSVTYREFLPLLIGRGALKPYRGHRPGVDPAISNEFATAAYRLGHSLLSPTLRRANADGSEAAGGSLSLAGAFFRPDEIATQGVDTLLRGLCLQRCQELDEQVVDDVRNFLFGAPGSGGLDLASLNIQRGRDHGLASYAGVRAHLGLRPAKHFRDINPQGGVAARLAAVYASPADVDLWIGGLAEAKKPGAMVGPVFERILADQFTRLRDADRFWYQAYLTPEMVRMVERQTLAVILRRNTTLGTEIREPAFLAPVRTAPARPASLPR
jgi:peroxidase